MEKKQNNNWVIRCPHCGMEYHIAEIFNPEDLTGTPRNIIRDPLGKVLYIEYEEDGEPKLVEHFVCDSCDKAFIVEASISFKTRPEEEERDFSTLETSLL